MGDTRYRWDGDTLVADVVALTDQLWLDQAGNFHSTEIHIVERYRMTGADTIEYEARIEDPVVYSKPWTLRTVLYRVKEPGARIIEDECLEDANGVRHHISPSIRRTVEIRLLTLEEAARSRRSPTRNENDIQDLINRIGYEKIFPARLLFLVTGVAASMVYAAAQQQTQAAVRLIAGAAEALGGRERILAVKTIVLEGYGEAAYMNGGGNISASPDAPQNGSAYRNTKRRWTSNIAACVCGSAIIRTLFLLRLQGISAPRIPIRSTSMGRFRTTSARTAAPSVD